MEIPEVNSDVFMAPPKAADQTPMQPQGQPMEEAGVADAQPDQQPSQPVNSAAKAPGRTDAHTEHCASKVHVFCEKVLKVHQARERVHTDMAHRFLALFPEVKPAQLLLSSLTQNQNCW